MLFPRSPSGATSAAADTMPVAKLRRSLSLRQVVVIGLAYLTPMTVFDSFAIVSQKTGGHVPSAYVLALIAMLLTALSYGKLSRCFPQAGSAYTYVQNIIGNRIGFMIGWLSLMDYILLPMINALLARIYLSALFPAVPEWIWVVGFAAVITAVNLRSVNWVAHINTLLVWTQVAMMALFVILVWHGLSHEHYHHPVLNLAPFISENTRLMPLLSGATVLCFSFLGFDAVSTLSEEVHQPARVVPRAIFLVALYGGAIFIGVSYFIQLYFPESGALDPNNALPEIAKAVGGELFQVVMLGGTLIGVLASGIACQTSVSRLLFVMGRDRVFPPAFFAYLHPKWDTPVLNTLFVGAVALSALCFDLENAMALINFGALVAFTFVNLAVIWHFYVRLGKRKTMMNHLMYLVLPSMGMAGIGVLWINLSASALTLGLIWGGLGAAFMLYKTRGLRQPMPTVDNG